MRSMIQNLPVINSFIILALIMFILTQGSINITQKNELEAAQKQIKALWLEAEKNSVIK